jgi:hypothetical protein
MMSQEEKSKSLDLCLVLCWIGGPILAIAVILALSGDNGRLRYTSDEFTNGWRR